MSTTFGVIRPGVNMDEDLDDDDKYIVVARRSSLIHWVNELAPLLPQETPVHALDNTDQGVLTIRDLKKLINEG